MHLTARESNIVLILQMKSCNLEWLANELNISVKTLKNDITNINRKISSFDSKIIVNHLQVSFSTIYSPIHWKNIIKLNMTIEEQEYVFLKLLFKTDYIAMADFAQEVYISKSKLEKMIATSPLLNEYISRKRNVGIAIEVDLERQISLAISTLLPYVDDLNYLVTARALVQQLTDQEIKIEQFKASVATFNQVVANHKTITDNECKILILLILISEHLFKLDEQQINQLIHQFISDGQSDQQIKIILERQIRETLLANNLTEIDQRIIESLVVHLENAITSPFANTINDQMELRIKSQYSYAYNLATELYNAICKLLSIELEDYEKNYIAMYVQSLVNNNSNNQKMQILIVCQYGMSVSNYIQVWIERNIDIPLKFKICSVLSYWNIQDQVSDYDVVITTIDNLEVDNTNVIQVDSIPLEYQLQELKTKVLNTHFQKQINNFLSSNSLKQIDISSIDEMYNLIQTDFHHGNRAFIEAMKKRTDQGLSNVNGVIIMHSDGSLITEDHLLIYKLKQPIMYNNEQVKMIFVFAFSTDFLEKFSSVIKQIYRVIYSEQYVSALYETATDKQFMWIFRNQIKGGNYVNK